MPGVRTGMESTHDGSFQQPKINSFVLQSPIKDEADNADNFGGDVSDSDSDDGHGYKPRPRLPQPNVNMRSLASLIKELESGVINVDPEYQREVVWTADRMTGLIDSLMENYYIPPIILNKKQNTSSSDSASRDTLVCVDGKQRLSSVRAFVKGMIPCHDHKGEKWWFCDTPENKRKKVLPLETQKLFLEKDFVAFQFTELTAEQEEDLFARVQMGVQLSVAEKMRAKQGPWQELAKLFVEDFPAIYNLMKDRARAKDFQLTLACFSQILEAQHPTAANGIPMLKTNYNALPKLLSNIDAVDDALKSHLASVWTIFGELIERDPDTFTNDDRHLSGVQTFAPVEMVAVTVLISIYSETRNNELLLGDIKALRKTLREHFRDLRLNTVVWKFVWNFIEDLEVIRGAVHGTTANWTQVSQVSKPIPSSTTVFAPAYSTPTVSRKRAAPPNKPLPILPPRDSVFVTHETQQDLATPKRQRTDPSPSNATASTIGPVRGNVSDSQFTDATYASLDRMRSAAVATKSPIVRNMSSQFGFQQQSPVSTTSVSSRPWSAGISPQLSMISNHSPHTGPMQPISGSLRWTLQKLGNGHEHYNSPYTTSTLEPAVPQIQQTRVSEPSNYHTPVTPVQPWKQLYPTFSDVPKTNQSSQNRTTISSRPPNMNQARLTSRGAFAPTHTNRDWEGIIASASSQLPSQELPRTQPVAPSTDPSPVIPVTATVAPQPNGKKRKSVTRPTPAQCDGAIDLTSDNELEEERQNLLSSFKAKTVPARQPPATTTAAPANAATGSTRRKPMVIHDLDLEKEFAVANNPYERFKRNPRACLSASKN